MRSVFVLVALCASALAEPRVDHDAIRAQIDDAVADGQRRIVVTLPDDAAIAPATTVSRTIFLDRCAGGCTINGGGVNDAEHDLSTIPLPGPHRLTEFENSDGDVGAAADAEWAMIVQCMREVYSPYDVDITDVRPPAGPYHRALIAGNPPDVGLDFTILGVAPIASNCAPVDNVISFSFANAHNQSNLKSRVENICWTAAQESAHAFGLDHEFEFIKDGRSACSDPMTYRFDCGGQKFYRNSFARCGELDGPRACRCSTNQNSHKKLLQVFGAGTPITTPPTATLTNPPATATELPVNVIAVAGSQRGVTRAVLFLNGSPYAEVPGAAFGPLGQPDTSYGILVPSNVPDSIFDVFVRVFDDLGAFTDTATVTVTKGTPCATADTCLPEQKCEAGRCFWDPPAGEIGDDCTFPQFCKSNLCTGTAEQSICTQTCEPEDPDGCPAGLSCIQNVCFFEQDGGCCSTSRDGWAPAGFGAVLVGLLGLRRRRGARSAGSRVPARR